MHGQSPLLRPSAPFLYEVASHVKNCHSGHYYYYYLLLNLRSPRDYVVRSSVRPSVVCSRLWYVLDRQLLNGRSHRHQNRRLCSRPHSNESVIFSNFWDSYFSSYGEFGEFSLKFTAAVSAVAQRSLCLQRKRLAVVDFGPAWHC